MSRLPIAKFISMAALVGTALTAAFNSGVYSWTAFLAKADPQRALVSDPVNGTAIVSSITQKIERDPTYEPGRREANAVAASLLERPLNEGALRILGSISEAEGKAALAEKAMRLSDRVSRRDVLAQLWLIENSVQKNDVKSAIKHYHSALTLRSEVGTVLFPVLSSALVHDEVRLGLHPYVKRNVAWMPSFLNFTAVSAPSQAAAALMEANSAFLKDSSYDAAKAVLVHRIFAEGSTSTATKLSARLWPDIGSRVQGDFAISTASRDIRLGKLGWNFPQGEGISSSAEDDGSITATVSPLARGTIAERDFVVTPKQTYRLISNHRQNEADANADLRWIGACVYVDRAVPLFNELLSGTRRTSTYEISFVVPPNCSLIRFSLAVRGPDGQSVANVTVSNLRLSRM